MKIIEVGEIVIVNDREYILNLRSIGGTEKKRPALILLKNILINTPRKLRGCKRTKNKRFKTIKLSNVRRL